MQGRESGGVDFIGEWYNLSFGDSCVFISETKLAEVLWRVLKKVISYEASLLETTSKKPHTEQ